MGPGRVDRTNAAYVSVRGTALAWSGCPDRAEQSVAALLGVTSRANNPSVRICRRSGASSQPSCRETSHRRSMVAGERTKADSERTRFHLRYGCLRMSGWLGPPSTPWATAAPAPEGTLAASRKLPPTKRLIIASAALLSGCSPGTHTYTVETQNADSPVVSAEVSVCRQPMWSLERSGTRFAGANRKQCEGSGFIRLTHQDETTTDCQVGYVTTLDQTLAYVVAGRSCEPQP